MDNKSIKEMPCLIHTKEELIALRNVPTKDVAWDGMAMLRSKSAPSLANFVALALLAYWKKYIPSDNSDDIQNQIEQAVQDADVRIKLTEVLRNCYREVTMFADKWSAQELLSVIVSDFSWYSKYAGKQHGLIITPQPFSYLARTLLRINNEDTVLDYCSGTGEFIIDAYMHTEASVFYGTEIWTEAVIVSKIRALLIGDKMHIQQGNSVISKVAADKVYADPPFAMKSDSGLENWRPQNANLSHIYENIPRTRRMDWTFVLSALSKQKEGGRTVILTYDGLLFRSSKGEQKMRRYLVESGRLEAVIALPQGIIPTTNVLCDLLVFSQNNSDVKMVDARDCKVKERFTSEMTEQNLEEVLQRISEETDFSRTVSHEEIANMEYVLSPVGYIAASHIKVENGVALGDLLISLERGQLTPATTLEELSTKEETNFQYLMLKDIEDDAIRTPLPYLTDIPKEWDKFCLATGNLVISRSFPTKIAIIPDLQGKKILANGNMYFMELDEERINPIYVLCYLKSRDGLKQIEYLSKGSMITTLSIKDLQQIQIPIISMEEQSAIANKYTSLRRHIASLKRQTRELESQIASLIEEAG